MAIQHPDEQLRAYQTRPDLPRANGARMSTLAGGLARWLALPRKHSAREPSGNAERQASNVLEDASSGSETIAADPTHFYSAEDE